MKATLYKAIQVEKQAKYDEDLIVYHTLGLRQPSITSDGLRLVAVYVAAH